MKKSQLTIARIASMAFAAVLAACGGSGSGGKSPGEDLGAPGVRWSLKNHEQRMGFMAAVVHPRMKKLFADYDKSFSDFSCQSCHGSDMELVDYKMPTDDLYPLPKEDTLEESRDYDEEVTDFMLSKVVPELKELMNQGEGPPVEVSCFSCHPEE